MPWSKRTRKAVAMVRKFLMRHTKREIKIDKTLNEELWRRGIKKPPREIRVKIEGDTAFLVK